MSVDNPTETLAEDMMWQLIAEQVLNDQMDHLWVGGGGVGGRRALKSSRGKSKIKGHEIA